MNKETEDFLNQGRPNNDVDAGAVQVSLSVPPEVTPKKIKSLSVDEMREQLEIKNLQIEIEKLEKPNTNIDYFQKMLDLQQQNFNSQMQMIREQNDLKLEIEKLKINNESSDDSFMDIVKGILPILPQLLKKQPSTIDAEPTKTKVDTEQPPKNTEVESEQMKIPTKDELEEYRKGIKDGSISLDEAYADYLDSPYAKLMPTTKEKFEVEYNKIKNS